MTPNKDEKDLIDEIEKIIKKNIDQNTYDLSRLIVTTISYYAEQRYEEGYEDGYQQAEKEARY